MTTSKEPIALTGVQMKSILALAGLTPGDESPLSDLGRPAGGARLGRDDVRMLREHGWLEEGDPARLTAEARAALEALCYPTVSASLLVGTRESMATTRAYSARGFSKGALVSYAADPERDEYWLLLGQSPASLADALTAQVVLGPLDEPVDFQAALEPVEFVTLLCILDWRMHALLAATLDRELNPDVRFTVRAVWEMLVEGRTAFDLAWQVTLFTYLLPFLDYELDERTIETALQSLQERHLVSRTDDSRYAISDPLLELGDALLPVVSYAALHIEEQDESGGVSSTHLVFLRGSAAILVVQPVVDERGRRVLVIDSVDGVELAEMLFELGLPGRQLVGASPGAASTPATALSICPACGAHIKPGAKFCTQCGAPLAEPPGARGG